MANRSRLWMRVSLRVAGALFALFCVALGLRHSVVVERLVRARLVEILATSTGEQVFVGRVKLEVWPTRLNVYSLEIAHHETGERIARVPELRAEIDWSLAGPTLDGIRIRNPAVRLHVEPDGRLREFRNAAPTEGESLWSPYVAVERGDVRVDFPQGFVALQGLNVQPETRQSAGAIRVAQVWLRWERFERKLGPLQMPGAQVKGDRIVLPEVLLDIPGLRLAGNIAAIRDGPLAGSLDVNVALAEWGVLGEKVRFDGDLAVAVEVFGTTADPQIGGSFALKPWTLWLIGPTHERPLRLGPVASSWGWRPGAPVEFSAFEMRWAEGVITGDAQFVPKTYALEAALKGTGLRLEPVLRDTSIAPTPWVHFLADMQVELAGSVSPFLLEGPFALQATDLRIYDEPAETAETEPVFESPTAEVAGRLSWALDEVLVIGADITLPRSALRADISLGVKAPQPLRADIELVDFDLAEAAPLRGLEVDGRMVGKLVLDGPLTKPVITANTTVLGFALFDKSLADYANVKMTCSDLRTLSFEEFHADKGRSRYQGRLDVVIDDPLLLDLQILTESIWVADATSPFVDLPQIDGEMQGTASLQGPVDELTGEIELQLRDVEIFGEPFPVGHARASMLAGHFTLSELLLKRRGGDEALLGRGSVGAGYATNVEFVSDGLRLESLTAVERMGWSLSGPFVGDLTLGGTLMDMTFDGQVSTSGTHYGDGRIGSSVVRFHPEGARTVFEGTLLGDAVALTGHYDWETDTYGFDGILTEVPIQWLHPNLSAGTSLRGSADGQVGVYGALEGSPDFGLDLSRVELIWGAHTLRNAKAWRIDRTGNRVQLRGVSLTDEDGVLTVEGGAVDGQLDIRMDGRLALDWLEALTPDVIRATGLARVRGSARGSIEAPEIEMDMTVSDGLIRSVYFPHTFDEVEGKFALSPDGYTWSDVIGRVGGGELASLGRIDAVDWVPIRYDIDAELRDGEIQYIDWLPPVRGDARMKFDGEVGELLLSGDVDVAQVVFAERIDWEQWVLELRDERLEAAAPEETEDYFAMDIAINAPETGRVRNNVADARLSGELRVVGSTARPGMTGTVRALPAGRGYLKDREFDILRGEVRFIDPYTFDPELDFLLETEVSSSERDWRVSYMVTGPFSDWQINARSDPPLSQADINALLLFGVTSEALTDGDGVAGGMGLENVVMLVGEAGAPILVEWLVGGLLQGVDRWDVVTGPSMRGARSTDSSPRLLVEKDVSSWDVTFTGEVNVTDPADTYLGVEKRLAERLFLTTYWLGDESVNNPTYGAYGLEFKLRWEVD